MNDESNSKYCDIITESQTHLKYVKLCHTYEPKLMSFPNPHVMSSAVTAEVQRQNKNAKSKLESRP